MAATRQSNIELCRIVSIILVMLVHTTEESLGHDISLGARLLEGFSVIGVNVFVMITGYFSATPKKTSLINLIFICFFWMIIKVVFLYINDEPISYKYAFFITSSNWFIPSYIGLLFFAPILNTFCNTVSKKMLVGGVFSLLFIEIWFGWLPPYPESGIGTKGGYSMLSFIILYLLARTIRLYGLPEWFKKFSLIIYVVLSILTGVLSYLGYYAGIFVLYCSPFVILSSVAFLVMFEKMSLHSKFINHIAKSTLAVLLGHTSISLLYTKQFKFLYDNFSGLKVVSYWILAVAIVFCISVLIDQIRILIYKPIENQLKLCIKNNNIFGINN